MAHAFTLNPDITRAQVLKVPEPKFTETWRPTSHKRVVLAMEDVCKKNDIIIKEKKYALGQGWDHPVDGEPTPGHPDINMFACYTIDNDETSDKRLGSVLIFRNSIGKAFSIGMNAGTETWACTNLMVFGTFVEFRKHTGGLDNDQIRNVFQRGFDRVIPRMAGVYDYHNAMGEIKCNRVSKQALGYQALQEGILSARTLPRFHEMMFGNEEKEVEPKYPGNTLWDFHGVLTELFQDYELSGTFWLRQKQLNNFLDSRFKLPAVDFSEN